MNRSSAKSKECDICRYWYFLDKNFSYQPHLCNGCHDLMQKAMRIHFWYMSKDDAISIMHNSNLIDKKRYAVIFLHIKNERSNLLSEK